MTVPTSMGVYRATCVRRTVLLLVLHQILLVNPLSCSAFQQGSNSAGTTIGHSSRSKNRNVASALSVLKEPTAASSNRKSITKKVGNILDTNQQSLNQITSKRTDKNNNKTKQKSNRDKYNEVERLRHALQQSRSQITESQLRATAAERRVALMNAELRDLQQEGVDAVSSGTDLMGSVTKETEKRLKKKFDRQTEKLTAKVREFAAQLQQFKQDAEIQLQSVLDEAKAEQTRLNHQIATLKTQLDESNQLLTKAQSDVTQLKAKLSQLEADLDQCRQDVAYEREQVQSKQWELDAVRSDMIDKLARSKEAASALKVEIGQMSEESEQMKSILHAREEVIETYEGERRSIRKLVRLMVGVLRERVGRPFRRHRRRS